MELLEFVDRVRTARMMKRLGNSANVCPICLIEITYGAILNSSFYEMTGIDTHGKCGAIHYAELSSQLRGMDLELMLCMHKP